MVSNTRPEGSFFWTVLLNLLRQIGLYIIVGLGGALLLLYLFAELTEDLLANEFKTIDNNFELWVHSFANPGLDLFFNFFTTIGGVPGITILTAASFVFLLWKRHFYSAIILLLAVGGGLLINLVLKELFKRPRPALWENTIAPPSSFSFPSGHATMSFCFFTIMIWIIFHLLKSRGLQIGLAVVMVFTILMVGLSRIYLGVHYPTDVVGGYLSAGFWILLLVSGDGIFKKLHLPRSREIIPPASRTGNQI
jgi:undecaprenyl-diphosphatase